MAEQATQTIRVDHLTTKHEMVVNQRGNKLVFEKVKEIEPSRRGTNVKVRTANHNMVFDGYLGFVEVKA